MSRSPQRGSYRPPGDGGKFLLSASAAWVRASPARLPSCIRRGLPPSYSGQPRHGRRPGDIRRVTWLGRWPAHNSGRGEPRSCKAQGRPAGLPTAAQARVGLRPRLAGGQAPSSGKARPVVDFPQRSDQREKK
ncbi:hypothetical protein NL676_008149 [Syzygium grande]|nr:hypothetical protein NL676_008149 [Syzygium grande]